jgi:hypothetical protein
MCYIVYLLSTGATLTTIVSMSGKPATFVINLKHRTDRRIAMEKQLSKIGWDVQFFSAVRPDDAAGFPSVGARGCFLSHLAVLKAARDDGVQQLTILEDDVNFAPDFRDRWQLAMSELDARDWAMFYPGHIQRDLSPGLSLIAHNTGVRCTHFMVIKGRALSTIIGGLEGMLSRPPGDPEGGPMHVDGAYSTIRKQQRSLPTYLYSPTLGYQRPSRTDVGSLKWFDRSRVFTPIVSFARKLKSLSRRNAET